MKKSFKKILALVMVLVLLAPTLSVAVTAIESEGTEFEYVTGGNPVSESYKNSKFYDYLSRVKITGDQRTDVIAVALTQSGYLESDIPYDFAGTYQGGWKDFTEYNYNMGDWGAGYGYDESIGAAMHWCASFVSWAILQSRVYTIQKGSISDWCRKNTDNPTDYMWREVGVGHWVDQIKRAGYYKDSHAKGGDYIPLTGDIIFFTNDGTSRSHIGLVVYADEDYVYTVEGNTSAEGYSDNSACCAVKSYAHTSTYIYGYGAMPYKTVEGAATIDFSGKTRTTGYYMNTNGVQNIYADEDCEGTIIGQIVRNTMFGVIEVCDNGMLKVVSEVYGGSVRMGYINPNKTRTLQITNETINAKSKLQMLTDSATGIYYKEYTEETLAEIRSAYIESKSVLADASSTDDDYNAMYEKLNTLLETKGTNAATAGARVDCFDQRISSGLCTIFTSDFNGGNLTTENGNLTYSAAIKAKWDATENAYKVESVVSSANGIPNETTIADDEIVIAAHDWETGVTEGPVLGSATNFATIKNAKYGQIIKMYGIDVETKTFEPGAYISLEGEGDGSSAMPDLENLVFGKDGGVTGYSGYTANLTDGVAANSLTYDDNWFAFYYKSGSSASNAPNGVGTLLYDLGEVKEINSVKVNTFVGNDSGIAAPAGITAYVSDTANGTFTKLGDLAFGTAYNEVAWASLDTTANGRYVKIEVHFDGTANPFVFINEVMVVGGDIEGSGTETSPNLGDANGNGTFEAIDYILLKRSYFGTYPLEDTSVGDINQNDSFEAIDYILTKRAYFGTYVIS